MDITSLIGRNVLVRTVTHYYTGRLASCGEWLHLEFAAWVADTGRFADALETGTLSEVEPYPADCWVSTGAAVDVSEWRHDLPRKQR